MSGCSDSKVCPVCGSDMDVYTDYRPFDTVNMNCLHCGFHGYVKCGMNDDANRKETFLNQGFDPDDYAGYKLTAKQRREYLSNFKYLCGDVLTPEEEARYLRRPYSPARKVVIEVYGGIAGLTSCPADVEVEIIDHDHR